MSAPAPTASEAASPWAVLEEAVALLQSTRARAWAAYAAGTLPGVAVPLWYWTEASWAQPTDTALALGAVCVVLSFVWMRTWQSRFMAELRADLLGAPVESSGVLGWVGAALFLARNQAWTLLLQIPASVLVVPVAFLVAHAHNLLYFGTGSAQRRAHAAEAAWRETRRWPRQLHSLVGILSLLWLMLFINLWALALVVPYLLNRMLGLATWSAGTPWLFWNSTFFACLVGLTYLVATPLTHAVFCVRCHRGRSRADGEDIRVGLSRAQKAGVGSTALALALGLLLLLPCPPASAQELPPPESGAENVSGALGPEQIEQGVREALSRPEFRWRLPPDGPVHSEKSWLEEALDWVGRQWRRFDRWLQRVRESIFGKEESAPRVLQPQSEATLDWVLWLQYGALVLCGGVLLWLLLLWVRSALRREKKAAPVGESTPAGGVDPATAPATDLTAPGWEALARELMARGDLRLALRAWHLAGVASLGAAGWLALSRFKTDRDYERELARRGSEGAPLQERLAGQRVVYEGCWYGRAEVSAETVQSFARPWEVAR